MRSKRKNNGVVEPIISSDSIEEATLIDPCNAWAFLLGPSFNAFCPLAKGHDGDHQVEINIFAEPKSHFVVSWGLDD